MNKRYFTSATVGDRNYNFALEWDDREFEEGYLNFKIIIDSWHIDQERRPEDRESFTFEVAVEADGDEQKPALKLKFNDNELISLPFDEIFSEDEIIEMIPGWVYGVGDPVCGCLIRSGLSVTIGQLIKCKNQTSEKSWFWERAKSIGKCLKQSFPKMCGRLAFKVARCMLKVGF
jgi:hypothetical protein